MSAKLKTKKERNMIMFKYQAYAWNGNKYLPISVPIYNTEEEAIQAATEIIQDRNNESVLNSIRRYWKEKPIITERRGNL